MAPCNRKVQSQHVCQHHPGKGAATQSILQKGRRRCSWTGRCRRSRRSRTWDCASAGSASAGCANVAMSRWSWTWDCASVGYVSAARGLRSQMRECASADCASVASIHPARSPLRAGERSWATPSAIPPAVLAVVEHRERRAPFTTVGRNREKSDSSAARDIITANDTLRGSQANASVSTDTWAHVGKSIWEACDEVGACHKVQLGT
eukprot:7391863-Prymnesium_polylepis.3